MIPRTALLLALTALSLSSAGCWRHHQEARHVDVVEVRHDEPRGDRHVDKHVDEHEDRR